MTIASYDLITVSSAYVTIDLIVWQRYRMRTRGLVELTMDVNPHLAKLHKFSPFLPVGTQVRIPIDPEIMKGTPKPQHTIQIYGRIK